MVQQYILFAKVLHFCFTISTVISYIWTHKECITIIKDLQPSQWKFSKLSDLRENFSLTKEENILYYITQCVYCPRKSDFRFFVVEFLLMRKQCILSLSLSLYIFLSFWLSPYFAAEVEIKSCHVGQRSQNKSLENMLFCGVGASSSFWFFVVS